MVNIYEAKARFSKLVARVEAGEEIQIARAGRPVARLVPIDNPRSERKCGSWAGRIHLQQSLNAPDYEIWDEETSS
ncbi:MAG: type II toxin-antitoxin system prevent-host-death family antitoxin [Myxococcota bacterium]|jgi:prevent-host-death family protein|nr:type II toxin-antitoxin system prevent-host-death family antitoxin [Myxococcota bacterium]